MSYSPNLPPGQATKANSAPVTIASNQDALPITDNGGSLTVDGTVAVSNPGLTDTQLRATPLPVSGTITATPTGTQDDNIKQVNGVTVNVGIGTAGTGTQRVAVSSDSFPSSQAVTGTFFQATQPVSAAALPLPTGASTSSLQGTGNTSVASIDTKTPALGQALAAASVPIVLTAAQVTTLTPPAAITNYANETGGNLATIAGKDFATQTTLALIKAKTDNIDVALSTRTKAADQQHVIVDSSASIAVTGPLTDTQLRATPVPVSGTVTATPSGTQDDNIKQVNGATVNVGIGTAGTGTQRVAVSSDSFPASQAVTGTFFQGTQPVSLATNTPTLQSGSTTAVTQPTAANLNATVVGTGTFAVQDFVGTVSAVNSSATPLGGGAVFTGTSEDVSGYGEIRVTVFTDQASATNGLSIQQSSDGTNWDITDTYTIAASTGKTYGVPRDAKFFRVVYTNGATPQGAFRLQTIYNRTATTLSSQRSSDGYTNETDLEQVWSFDSVWNGTTWDRTPGDVNGLKTKKLLGATTTSANIATSTTVATLVASNTTRVKATVYNDSTGILYVKEGAAASATSFDYALSPSSSTSPGGTLIVDDYNGILTGILSTGTGSARVGETTP